ncbi:metallophosphoesterase [Myxococcota bacterium]|nr:metallophosphoesterase [Myxococcota bacterium]MBU1380605.1 metallophosphoesterase [Myxococcota bacterium]MBU1497734.1 metallophosphoesterase [Myxococcota bacterium]
MKHYLLLFIVLFFFACKNDAGDRVENDKKIGFYQNDNWSVRIASGLGNITYADNDKIHIWSQSPVLDIEFTADSTPFTVTFHLHNMMSTTMLYEDDLGTSITKVSSDNKTQVFDVTLLNASARITAASPDQNSAGEFSFALVSDIQDAVYKVDDIWDSINSYPEISFVVSTGDLTHRGTTEQMDVFFSKLELLEKPFYSTAGNHDVGWDREEVWARRFGRVNFSFVYRHCYFTFIDSASAGIHPDVYSWLDTWLENGKNSVHTVITHYPPVDPDGTRNASFSSRMEAWKFLKMLAKANVDLTLYGHIHSYYAFQNAGIDAYISGGGGGIDEHYDGMGRHWLRITIDANEGIKSVDLIRVD